MSFTEYQENAQENAQKKCAGKHRSETPQQNAACKFGGLASIYRAAE
ncbi:MAG TPA: hypothetical protein VJ752_18000 [Burkholderiaceae bacterium]|nr:hypothetical protein [Burkholderiaceae bacterium]